MVVTIIIIIKTGLQLLVADPNVDEVVQSGVVQRHVVSPTIQLVLVESYQTPVVDQVVHRQPLLKVFLQHQERPSPLPNVTGQ